MRIRPGGFLVVFSPGSAGLIALEGLVSINLAGQP